MVTIINMSQESKSNLNRTIDIYITPNGDGRSYEIFQGPYRQLRDDDDIPVEYTNEIIEGTDGRLIVPVELFGE